ncbi:MAG: hypothetical protein WBQ25_25715, partial [Nitrososphaeraceae archaeon]
STLIIYVTTALGIWKLCWKHLGPLLRKLDDLGAKMSKFVFADEKKIGHTWLGVNLFAIFVSKVFCSNIIYTQTNNQAIMSKSVNKERCSAY